VREKLNNKKLINKLGNMKKLDVEPTEPTEPTEPKAQPVVGSRKKSKKETMHVCEFCSQSFATRLTLRAHVEKGICLGKGYMCLRCFKVKRTSSELQRHQGSDKKCKPSISASITRDEHGTVNIVIKK
jgi:hypothetical protein